MRRCLTNLTSQCIHNTGKSSLDIGLLIRTIFSDKIANSNPEMRCCSTCLPSFGSITWKEILCIGIEKDNFEFLISKHFNFYWHFKFIHATGPGKKIPAPSVFFEFFFDIQSRVNISTCIVRLIFNQIPIEFFDSDIEILVIPLSCVNYFKVLYNRYLRQKICLFSSNLT